MHTVQALSRSLLLDLPFEKGYWAENIRKGHKYLTLNASDPLPRRTSLSIYEPRCGVIGEMKEWLSVLSEYVELLEPAR